MLVLSPRSYITGAFDLLFPVLLKHVYNTFSYINDWWSEYVFENRNDIFTDNIIKKRVEIERNFEPKNIDDLYDYFDEASLLNLINFIPFNINSIFANKKHFKDIKSIRNEWAHRGDRIKKWKDDEHGEKEWAINSFHKIKRTAELLNEPKLANELSTLLSKMEHDWLCKDLVFRTHTELIKFLDEKVMIAVCESKIINNEIKQRVINSRDKLIKKAKTPEYVIDFFYNAIKEKNIIHTELNKNGLNTFESVCAEFAVFCLKD